MTCLLEACRNFEPWWKNPKPPPELRDPGKPPDVLEDPEGFRKWSVEADRFLAAVKEVTDKLDLKVAVYDQLLAAMADAKDPRAVDCLNQLLKWSGASDRAVRVATALLSFATREALVAVAGHVRDFQDAVESKQKEVQKIRLTRKEAAPDYWKGNKRQWEQRETERIAGLVDKAEVEVRKVEQLGRDFVACLVGFAKQHGLPEPPGDLRGSAWQGWTSRACKRLPEPASVGK